MKTSYTVSEIKKQNINENGILKIGTSSGSLLCACVAKKIDKDVQANLFIKGEGDSEFKFVGSAEWHYYPDDEFMVVCNILEKNGYSDFNFEGQVSIDSIGT